MVKRTLQALILVAVAMPLSKSFGAENSSEPTPLEVFEQRIMPIFKSPQPSSCVQCHLSSVDLKNYILPSHEKTFLSLRDQGLIDLEHPAKSKILHLIQMGEKDLDDGARMIHEKTRAAEYEAFASWIEACCNDADLRNLQPLSAAERARRRHRDPRSPGGGDPEGRAHSNSGHHGGHRPRPGTHGLV